MNKPFALILISESMLIVGYVAILLGYNAYHDLPCMFGFFENTRYSCGFDIWGKLDVFAFYLVLASIFLLALVMVTWRKVLR